MRFKYIILFIVFFLVGCNTLQLRVPRAKINNNDKIVTEVNKGEINKPEIRVPQIRKPTIKWRNKKVEQKQSDQIKQEVEAENKNAEISQLTNEERKKRFDSLLNVNYQKQSPEINESSQISEDKEPSLFDTIFTWTGALGVCAVFWAGVYFIAKNLLLK